VKRKTPKHRATKRDDFWRFRGRHVRVSLTRKISAVFAALALAVSPIVLLATQPASAYTIGSSFNLSDPNATGFGVYIDAPQVQNSYVNAYPSTAASTQIEDFNQVPSSDVGNGLKVGGCPATLAGGTVSGSCTIYGGAAEPDLGASSLSGDPAFGGNGSQFATADPAGTVIEFSVNQRYLGLWWSAGSPGNQIDFYSNDVLISSITTADLHSRLGAPPTSSTPSGQVLTAIDGNSYQKNFYYGHPRGYTAVPPTSTLFGTNFVPGETYSYIHAFANGSTSFDKVVLSSSIQNGFEFDNLVTSTATNLQPIGRLIPYNFFEAQKVVRFDKNAADAVGSMAPQTGTQATNLVTRDFARPGHVFYGWNTAADGSGTWYSDMGTYAFSSDVILYAQWQAPSGKPVISGLGVRVTKPTNTYSRPDAPNGLAIDWMGQTPLAGDEMWFLCDTPRTQPSDYFLSQFPSDCTPYPYGSLAGGAAGNVDFPLSQMIKGKYIAYGMWAQNGSGATYAIQSAPNPITLEVNGLASNAALSRTQYTIDGYPTSVVSGWYRCDNPLLNANSMPSGNCVSTSSNALVYTPTLADVGKHLIYRVTASIAGSPIETTKAVSGGPVFAMSNFVQSVFGDLSVNLANSNSTAQLTPIPTHPDLNQVDGAWLICNQSVNSYMAGTVSSVSQQVQTALVTNAGCAPVGATANAVSISVVPSFYGKYVAYFYMGVEVANTSKGLFVYRSTLVPTPPPPAPTPSASASTVASPSPSVTQSSSPIPSLSASPSATPSTTPNASASPRPSSSATPSFKPQPTTTPTTANSPQPASKPTPVVSTPSASPEPTEQPAVSATTSPSPEPTATALALPLLRDSDAEAIGGTVSDDTPSAPFDALSSENSARAFMGNMVQFFALTAGLTLASAAAARRKRKARLAAPGSQNADSETFKSNEWGWGDRLGVWRLGLARVLDKVSVSAVLKSARISPMASHLLNDGSYSRAMFGPMALVAPISAIALVLASTSFDSGLLNNSLWILVLLLALVSVFDAAAGTFALLFYFAFTVFTSADIWQDLRTALAVSLVVVGPVLVMTSFRSMRRNAPRSFSDWWERFIDLAVGPFIAGWSATIFVSVLPAIAGQTLAIANHVVLFGVVVALAAFTRVWLEEIAARAYPQRLDQLTPDSIPDSSKTQKFVSLSARYVIWNLMLAGVFGNTWQLWVGSAIILIPSVIAWYHERLPNSATLWRVMPTGIPGLAFSLSILSLVSAGLSTLVFSSAELAKWAFAILPLPVVAFAILALLGREGSTEHEVKPSKRNKLVYRIGGIAMLLITARLAGVA